MGDENIELALLGFLFEEPKHGYELFKEVSDPIGIGEVYRLKIGKMYSILKKLENQKLICASVQQDGNRPPKNLYHLTNTGQAAFKDWMSSPIKHGREFRILFLLKLFFINRNKTYDAKDLIFKQNQECRKWEKRILSTMDDPKINSSYQRMVKKYRLSQIEGYSKWLDWCERTVNEKNNT
ncbi:MAG: helix-turn-helix transcriptional regulator [Pelolinea sp.]|nr:helix-turn-helix transcriptional regulator [Pelolinea sp.]